MVTNPVDTSLKLTGRLDAIYPKICKTVDQIIAKNFMRLKVGVSNDYNQRYRMYVKKHKDYKKQTIIGTGRYPINPHRMYVIYETSSKDNAKLVEIQLSRQYARYLENEISGGGGKIGDTNPKYYVYLIGEKNSFGI